MKLKNDALSASAIKTYIHCPFKFFLEYILGHRKPQTFATSNGSLIHKTLEKISLGHNKWRKELFLRYKKGKPWLLLNEFKTHHKDCPGCEFLQNIDHYHGDFYEQSKGLYYDIIDRTTKKCPIYYLFEAQNLIDSIYAREYNPFDGQLIAAEKDFRIPLEYGVNISGIIDLVSKINDDTIEIRDWKTGNFIPTYGEALEDPQLRMYDLAASILFPEYKNRLLTFDYIKKVQYTFTFSDEQREFNRRWIISIAKKIEKDFNPRRILTYKCKSFCQPDICDREWPKKLITIKKLKTEGKV